MYFQPGGKTRWCEVTIAGNCFLGWKSKKKTERCNYIFLKSIESLLIQPSYPRPYKRKFLPGCETQFEDASDFLAASTHFQISGERRRIRLLYKIDKSMTRSTKPSGCINALGWTESRSAALSSDHGDSSIHLVKCLLSVTVTVFVMASLWFLHSSNRMWIWVPWHKLATK